MYTSMSINKNKCYMYLQVEEIGCELAAHDYALLLKVPCTRDNLTEPNLT